jgi:tryptophan-rich sensory protein
MKSFHSILVLALFIALCLGVSAAGAWFTSGSVATWYPALRKPVWSPPAWVFGPVWTVLYVMMATAAWLVWRKAGVSGAPGALGIFALQLALNAAWSPLFFGLRSPGAGLTDIVALWIAIGATLFAFWRIVPLAGVLLVPYWLWVSFATALNFALWRMNA